MPESEPADDSSGEEGAADAQPQRHERVGAGEVHVGEDEPGGVGAAGEKHRLTEGEDAEEAPQQVHGQSHRRVEERAGEHVHRIGVEQEGTDGHRHEGGERDEQDQGEAARFSHGRTPGDGHAG